MPHAARYSRLPTEQRNARTRHLDRLPTLALLRLMHREDTRAVRAVGRALPRTAQAVALIAQALRRGGRLFFVGAGTSGRLGVLEAAECPPTFHTSPSMTQAIIAGGRGALVRSHEGAEDNRRAARTAIRLRVRAGDVVVGIAASGVTPFVDEALAAARRQRATTILVTCNPRASISAATRIVLEVGPEVLAGSTRLKAGTATKLALNMLTLGAMVRLGKTHGNLMVDVRPTSRKLRARAITIIRLISRCSAGTAARALSAARGETKTAALMAARGVSVHVARRRLAATGGSLHRALHR